MIKYDALSINERIFLKDYFYFNEKKFEDFYIPETVTHYGPNGETTTKISYKIKSPRDIRKVILDDSRYSSLKYYGADDLFFIFNSEKKYYTRMGTGEFTMGLSQSLQERGVDPGVKFIHSVVEELKNSEIGRMYNYTSDIAHEFYTFKDLQINVKSGEMKIGTPENFCVKYIPAHLEKTNEIPKVFLRFMKDFTEGNLYKFYAIRCILSILIKNYTSSQIFCYIQGPAATGKSLLVSLFRLIAGSENTIATEFRRMSKDPFELYNLKGKFLILISDNEQFTVDLSTLKQVVGQDLIPGRKKYHQASDDFTSEGLVVIHSNFPLSINDDTGALNRRMVKIKANNQIIPSERKDLLEFKRGEWTGPLVNEVGAILRWGLSLDENVASKFLKEYYPAAVEDTCDQDGSTLENFIDLHFDIDESAVGKKSYLGFMEFGRSLHHKLDDLAVQAQKFIYPAYRLYCIKTEDKFPITNKTFSEALSHALTRKNIEHKRRKDKKGVYFLNIALKTPETLDLPKVKQAFVEIPKYMTESLSSSFDSYIKSKELTLTVSKESDDQKDIIILPETKKQEVKLDAKKQEEALEVTAPLEEGSAPSKTKTGFYLVVSLIETTEFLKVSRWNQSNFEAYDKVKLFSKNVDERNRLDRSPDLKICYAMYDRYLSIVSHLHKCTDMEIKREFQSYCKENLPLFEDIINAKVKDLKVPSEKFLHSVTDKTLRELKQLKEFGLFNSQWMLSLHSPRITPKKYQRSLMSISKVTRELVLKKVALHFTDYVFLDLDISSCFSTIVTNLYPEQYPILKQGVKEGLWSFMEKNYFPDGGFDKKDAKVCVYAAYFGGSTKAFSHQIVENFRKKNLGLTEEAFRETEAYDIVRNKANTTARMMENTPLIKELSAASEKLFSIYKSHKKPLVGPTGHYYPIPNEKVWKKAFPCFLQSYETVLIQMTVIYLKIHFQDDFIVISPFHDGAIVAVKKEQLEAFKKRADYYLTLVGKFLRFAGETKFSFTPFL